MAARVFADTNVLFPFSVMDLLLALSEDGVHELVWTERLLAEWERVIVRERKRSAETAASVTAAIRSFFADSEVSAHEYEDLVDSMPGDDADDRHHAAAAIAGGASVLLTRNVDDFPPSPLAERGVRVLDPDAYLTELLNELPDEVADVVVRLAAEKQRPPRTPGELTDALGRAGVPIFADKLRALLALRG